MEKIIQYLTEVCIPSIENIKLELYKNPTAFDSFETELEVELKKLGCELIKYALEDMDWAMKKSMKRKLNWHVERTDSKKLLTVFGTVVFNKTLFTHKTQKNEDGSEKMCYLLDKALGFSENQRLTETVKAKVYKEATESSYRKGGEAASATEGITKSAVKDLLHKTKFPQNFQIPKEKKVVEYLYIDADEDHYSLQFQNTKGDLECNEFGRKMNGAITKIIYVHEGIEPDAPKSKRHHLINPHYFCRGCEQENKELWSEVFKYIESTYDTEKIKKIYLSSDGGAWIKAGSRGELKTTFVLDEFHLSKYIFKLTSHMLDSQEDARREIYNAIRKEKKEAFNAVVERLKGCNATEKDIKRIDNAANYIRSNWSAAKYRLNKHDGLVACSAEGHVSHVLSARMSTGPMGWSRHGASQMARLREFKYNGGNVIELAKYQKTDIKEAVGAEEITRSASQLLRDEKTGRNREQVEYGKYSEVIRTSWTSLVSKEYYGFINAAIDW